MTIKGSKFPLESKILLQTFKKHWEQLRDISTRMSVPSSDDVVIIINLIKQMNTLLQMELDSGDETIYHLLETNHHLDSLDSLVSESSSSSSCLYYLVSENIPAHILASSRMPIPTEQQNALIIVQLRLYESLLGSSSKVGKLLLSQESILKPLLDLLNGSAVSSTKEEKRDTEKEEELLKMLHHLINILLGNPELLSHFIIPSSSRPLHHQQNNNNNKGSSNEEDFLIFSLSLPFLHYDGPMGQNARDTLLLCLSLSKKHINIRDYIIKKTHFCTILATGLSALYSRLPRFIDLKTTFTEFRITESDLNDIWDVKRFLESFKFCDAVIQVSHDDIKKHLLELIYMGFLFPVLGSALNQNHEDECICATVYYELCLRQISESSLLLPFLRLIFTEVIDNGILIDTLLLRLSSKSSLSLVTLSLFDTLISLNCEDVMYSLIFRHLLPLFPSFASLSHQPDLHGRCSQKLLALTPICCNVENEKILNTQKDLSPWRNYTDYLQEAKISVRHHYEATKNWNYPYDGLHPSVNSSCRGETLDASISSGYQSFVLRDESHSGPISLTEEETTEFWNLMKEPLESKVKKSNLKFDEFSVSSSGLSINSEDFETSHFRSELISFKKPGETSLGLFLDSLFERVETMASNSLDLNLLVTSLLSKLAAYPQPLLRSVLLHSENIGLIFSISSLRQKLDNMMPMFRVENALENARKFLLERINYYQDSSQRSPSAFSQSFEKKNSSRKRLSNTISSFFRRSNITTQKIGKCKSLEKEICIEAQKHGIAAIILEEWLYELSALAHEHSILQKELSFSVGINFLSL